MTSKKTVFVTTPCLHPFMDRFKPIAEKYDLEIIVPDVNERMSEEELLAWAGKFDGAICGDDAFTRKVMEASLPRLKVLSKWGTGIDSLDQVAAAELGVKVCNTPGAFTIPVSESALAFMLGLARKVVSIDNDMKKPYWEKTRCTTLFNKTLGVVGVGEIGKATVIRAKAFGMKILGNDIAEIDPKFLSENEVEMTSLDDLLSRSDYISLHCDLNKTSRGLISREKVALIKEGAFFINTARGPIVDEKALIEALQKGKLAGAGMDVFEEEPLPSDSPLLKMDNVILAPHNANSDPVCWERVHLNTIKNCLSVLGIEMDAEDWKPVE